MPLMSLFIRSARHACNGFSTVLSIHCTNNSSSTSISNNISLTVASSPVHMICRARVYVLLCTLHKMRKTKTIFRILCVFMLGIRNETHSLYRSMERAQSNKPKTAQHSNVSYIIHKRLHIAFFSIQHTLAVVLYRQALSTVPFIVQNTRAERKRFASLPARPILSSAPAFGVLNLMNGNHVHKNYLPCVCLCLCMVRYIQILE